MVSFDRLRAWIGQRGNGPTDHNQELAFDPPTSGDPRSKPTATIDDKVAVAAAAPAAGSGGDRPAITVLGTSGSYPGPGSACSGYLVRHRGFTLWLDAGPGTLANLQTHIGLADVDAVVVSHEHPDHWSDLDGFFVACRWVTPRSQVPVYAPSGVAEMMRSGGAIEAGSAFDWHLITDKDCLSLGPFDLTFARTDHPPETLAVRFDTTVAAGGDLVSFAYTADTGPGWSLDALGRDLDLVLSEATFLRDMEGSAPHLSARQAGAMARAAGARRLLLTHVWPTVDPGRSADEATEAFGAPVECCQMHVTYRL